MATQTWTTAADVLAQAPEFKASAGIENVSPTAMTRFIIQASSAVRRYIGGRYNPNIYVDPPNDVPTFFREFATWWTISLLIKAYQRGTNKDFQKDADEQLKYYKRGVLVGNIEDDNGVLVPTIYDNNRAESPLPESLAPIYECGSRLGMADLLVCGCSGSCSCVGVRFVNV